MVFKKRGQTGAIVVMMLVIAVFVTIYVMVLPENERSSLFDSFSEEEQKIARDDLLLVYPKRLDYIGDTEVEHSIPSFRIYTKKDATILADENIYLQSTILSKTKKDLSFIVENIDFVENLIIGGRIKESQGEIRIYLNDKLIYNAEDLKGNIGPISVSKEFIERNNILTIEVKNPGLNFWQKDYYDIDLNVVLNEKNIENQISKNKFYLNNAEKNNLEYIDLNFKVNCDNKKQSTLYILANGNTIYSAAPKCNSNNNLQIYNADIVEGENTIIFKVDEGDYDIHDILLISKLKQVDYPTYYFEVSKEELEEVNKGNLYVKADIDFLDTVDIKSGEVVINNYIEEFNQEESKLTIDLSDDIRIGNNGIQIRPLKSLDVRELRVYFE